MQKEAFADFFVRLVVLLIVVKVGESKREVWVKEPYQWVGSYNNNKCVSAFCGHEDRVSSSCRLRCLLRVEPISLDQKKYEVSLEEEVVASAEEPRTRLAIIIIVAAVAAAVVAVAVYNFVYLRGRR
jgi:hypothetical protein